MSASDRYGHPDDYWDVDMPPLSSHDVDALEATWPDYVHDPDDLHRPGSDTHTNTLREGT